MRYRVRKPPARCHFPDETPDIDDLQVFPYIDSWEICKRCGHKVHSEDGKTPCPNVPYFLARDQMGYSR